MSKWIVDIHGDIEGDYEIIKKYEEPKIGHWVRGFYKTTERHIHIPYYRCSECRKEFNPCNYNYCPNCGAYMKGEQ